MADSAEQRAIAQGFSALSNLPELCVGAVDCRENPIHKPQNSPEAFYNRKGFYSMQIQAVRDNTTRFLDVEVGWPGKSSLAGKIVTKIFTDDVTGAQKRNTIASAMI